ncbi:hypothetical protein V7968_02160 [Nocardia vulneris]|uniref:hypothetical protein n=1 Tax=Nocardia vulneris TaxID=1141657 RepID=UPI0030D055DC
MTWQRVAHEVGRTGGHGGRAEQHHPLDVVAVPLYWRLSVRSAPIDSDYLDTLTDLLLRALGAPT